MEPKGNILIVDDEPSVLASLKNFLAGRGYCVYAAETAEEALRLAREEIIDLAIIDIRLVDHRDEEDVTGLDLTAQLDPAIAKIILTAYEGPELVRRALSQRGIALAVDFVFKKDGPYKLLEAVEIAFQTKVCLNSELKIIFEKGLSWSTLVGMIKNYREKSDEARRKAAMVLERLVRKLFDKAQTLRMLRITPGRGGCGVVLAQPSFDGVPGSGVVIKFGPRKTISTEVDNYKQWVEPFAAQRATQFRGEPAKILKLGAIKYSFVGGMPADLVDFNAYYHRTDISVDTINETLRYLFEETCEHWYKGTRAPREHEKKPLDEWYKEQLTLDAKHIRELKDVLQQLMESEMLYAHMFHLKDKHGVQVTLGAETLDLPDPIHFTLEVHNSGKGSTLFPVPSLAAITHGDLNGTNILVDKDGKTWLIDFFKTGWGPALRDFAELETVIKFELLQTDSLLARYELEKALLAPRTFSESIPFENRSRVPELERARATIQRLRELARSLTDIEDVREYYIALLFYALREIIGFTSKPEGMKCCNISQYHALLSAAMICDMLPWWPAQENGSVFLAHEYKEPWIERIYKELKDCITTQGHGVVHPKDKAPGGILWARIAQMIDGSSMGFYEITTINGNVCFELGYAMGARKPFFALVNTDYVNVQRVPNILGGEWWVTYDSDQELQDKVQRILSQQPHAEPWHFFEQEDFKERVQQVKTQKRSALLAVANVPHLRQDVMPMLESVLRRTCNWEVEILRIEDEKDIQELYLKMAKYELVVGCFASDDILGAQHANAELALALGMTCGIQKKVIILQEEGCKTLADVKALTRKFRGKGEGEIALVDELKRQFPRRCRK